MSVSTSVSVHVNGCDFETSPYLLNERPFAVVSVKSADTGISIFLNTLEEAVSLVQAASEAVHFFAELEAAKAETTTEGGEHE